MATIIPGNWKAGAFMVTTDQGSQEIAGWVNGVWALDFRVYDDAWGRVEPGWTVNHLPTGFSAGCILDGLPSAQNIVEEIDAIGDWNSSDGKALGRKMSAGMKRLFNKFEGVLVKRTAKFSPTFGTSLPATVQ